MHPSCQNHWESINQFPNSTASYCSVHHPISHVADDISNQGVIADESSEASSKDDVSRFLAVDDKSLPETIIQQSSRQPKPKLRLQKSASSSSKGIGSQCLYHGVFTIFIRHHFSIDHLDSSSLIKNIMSIHKMNITLENVNLNAMVDSWSKSNQTKSPTSPTMIFEDNGGEDGLSSWSTLRVDIQESLPCHEGVFGNEMFFTGKTIKGYLQSAIECIE